VAVTALAAVTAEAVELPTSMSSSAVARAQPEVDGQPSEEPAEGRGQGVGHGAHGLVDDRQEGVEQGPEEVDDRLEEGGARQVDACN
jgi:hypothetical protein